MTLRISLCLLLSLSHLWRNWQLSPLQILTYSRRVFCIPGCHIQKRNALCMLNQTDGHHLYGLTMALYSQTMLYIPALPLSLISIQCQGRVTEITAIIAKPLDHLWNWHGWKWIAVFESGNYWHYSVAFSVSIYRQYEGLRTSQWKNQLKKSTLDKTFKLFRPF